MSNKEMELRQLFKNRSDCYADAEDVIQAMTEDCFIDTVTEQQAKTMYSEEILNILSNVLYWDTCPDDYKVVISNFLMQQNNEQ